MVLADLRDDIVDGTAELGVIRKVREDFPESERSLKTRKRTGTRTLP